MGVIALIRPIWDYLFNFWLRWYGVGAVYIGSSHSYREIRLVNLVDLRSKQH